MDQIVTRDIAPHCNSWRYDLFVTRRAMLLEEVAGILELSAHTSAKDVGQAHTDLNKLLTYTWIF